MHTACIVVRISLKNQTIVLQNLKRVVIDEKGENTLVLSIFKGFLDKGLENTAMIGYGRYFEETQSRITLPEYPC